jgi:hypothetical protein
VARVKYVVCFVMCFYSDPATICRPGGAVAVASAAESMAYVRTHAALPCCAARRRPSSGVRRPEMPRIGTDT